jgi:hypothetical protein
MAQTDTATKVDEEWVRSLFGGFNDPEEFFADPLASGWTVRTTASSPRGLS